jgi:hypothetical protein
MVSGISAMSKTDQWVIVTLISLIALHLIILWVGYMTAKMAYLCAGINLAMGFSVILYWVVRPSAQYSIDTSKMLMVVYEMTVVILAVYFLFSSSKGQGLRLLQYLFFGIHLAVLILGLLFMLTFKMNRLI